MKESKSTKIEIRMTESEKAQLKQFAQDLGVTISELVRIALTQIIGGKQNDK